MTAAMAIALGSYLALCSRSNQFSMRQVQLDKARELAQIGLEEALWALNQNIWTASGPSGNAVWVTSGNDRSVPLSYTLGGGLTGQVTLTIANYDKKGPIWPTITAVATLTEADTPYTKTLQATTGPAPLFANAIASAESYVRFNNGGTVDSWNSDPDDNDATALVPYSFSVTNPTNYAAVVAGRDDGSGSYGVMLEQPTIKGYASTFGLPVAYGVSSNAKVKGPNTAAGTNVDPARVGKSAFVPGPSVFTVSTPPNGDKPSLNLVLGLLNLVLQLLDPLLHIFKVNGDLYIDGGLVFPDLEITKQTKLVVTGDLTITGGGQIKITSTGSLELFVNGGVSIAGDGFDNQTNDPKKLAIYSTGTGSTPITLNPSQPFCGTIYSENKPISVGNNGPFYGALLSRGYVRFTAANPIFHYDLALRQTIFPSVTTPYVTKQVTEL